MIDIRYEISVRIEDDKSNSRSLNSRELVNKRILFYVIVFDFKDRDLLLWFLFLLLWFGLGSIVRRKEQSCSFSKEKKVRIIHLSEV